MLRITVIDYHTQVPICVVEGAIFEHRAVSEVAVVGLPDEQSGAVVVAVVVLASSADLALQQFRDFLAATLACCKLPRQRYRVESLPRNPTGKVQNFVLKQQLINAVAR